MSSRIARAEAGDQQESVTPEQALQLAQTFREAAKLIGDYTYANWLDLEQENRETLRALELTLLNLATDLVTHAVGIVLEKGMASLARVLAATRAARQALTTIANVKSAIVIATALIGLAAAVPTGKTDAIKAALKALKEATDNSQAE